MGGSEARRWARITSVVRRSPMTRRWRRGGETEVEIKLEGGGEWRAEGGRDRRGQTTAPRSSRRRPNTRRSSSLATDGGGIAGGSKYARIDLAHVRLGFGSECTRTGTPRLRETDSACGGVVSCGGREIRAESSPAGGENPSGSRPSLRRRARSRRRRSRGARSRLGAGEGRARRRAAWSALEGDVSFQRDSASSHVVNSRLALLCTIIALPSS